MNVCAIGIIEEQRDLSLQVQGSLQVAAQIEKVMNDKYGYFPSLARAENERAGRL